MDDLIFEIPSNEILIKIINHYKEIIKIEDNNIIRIKELEPNKIFQRGFTES